MDVPEIGGSYRRDPQTGTLTRVEGMMPDEAAPASTHPEPEVSPETGAAPAHEEE